MALMCCNTSTPCHDFLCEYAMDNSHPTPCLGEHAYTPRELSTINRAFKILERGIREPGALITHPVEARNCFRIWIGHADVEVFVALYLDAMHRVVHMQEHGRGSLTVCPVYPRELARTALQHNAKSLIVAHNHPSRLCEPSAADIALTRRIKSCLEVIDTELLDHILVCTDATVSFAERGLL